MATWKRDLVSGLVVLAPLLVTAYAVRFIFLTVARVPLLRGIEPPIVRVVIIVVIFVWFVFFVGYLMRTAIGRVIEGAIDRSMNKIPLLRVVYNASKIAVRTAFSGNSELSQPVRIETWNGVRMTAFKTGKQTTDGRLILFLPTAPNITSGYVIEVNPDRVSSTDESVEAALTRIISAGFGDRYDEPAIPIPVNEEQTGNDKSPVRIVTESVREY